MKVRVTEKEFARALEEYFQSPSFSISDFIEVEAEPVEDKCDCWRFEMGIGWHGHWCELAPKKSSAPTKEGECCERCAPSEIENEDGSYSRMPKMACMMSWCPCHSRVSEECVCEGKMKGLVRHTTDGCFRDVSNELPEIEELKFERGFANTAELAVCDKINEIIRRLRKQR